MTLLFYHSDAPEPCFFLVAGGCSPSAQCSESSAEYLDLCDDSSDTCSAPPDLPQNSNNGVSLTTAEGNPLFCGGQSLPGECYELVPEDNTWVEGPQLLGQRTNSAFTKLSDGRWWILSGQATNDQFSSEYYDDGRFTIGPTLPTEGYETCSPCAVEVDENRIFYGNKLGWLYVVNQNQFRPTNNPMLFESCGAACGSATKADGSKIIVVAGGNDNGRTDRVQILDPVFETWTEGPRMPYPLINAALVETEDSFLVIGGTGEPSYQDTVFEFDPIGMTWILREETLSLQRTYPFASALDKSRVCSAP